MKKLLTATTALALVGGAAFAEMEIKGAAELGIDYNSDPAGGASKLTFAHEVGVTFTGSATTDGGLSFGAEAGFDTKDEELNEGNVSVSGAFGTVSIGDVGRASDTAGGIADVGLNGVGVDDVVEDMRETSAKQINYSNSFGQISIAFSAGNTAAVAAVETSTWYVEGANNVLGSFHAEPTDAQYDEIFNITATTTAAIAGFSRNADGDVVKSDDSVADPDDTGDAALIADFENYEDAYSLGDDEAVGGDDDTRIAQTDNGVDGVSSDAQYSFGMSFEASGVTVGFGYDSEKTVSAGMGFSQGDIGASALYVKQDDGDTGMGADVSYAMGASKLVLAYAKGEADGASTDAMGVHFEHDLGGGATLVSGFGQVDDVNKASMGLKFTF